MLFQKFIRAPEGESAAADGAEAPAVEAAATPAPAAEAHAIEGAPGASLLSEAVGKTESGEAPAEGDAAKVEGQEPAAADAKEGGEAPAVEAKEPPAPEPITFEPFTLPEGVTLADEQVKSFTDILGDHNLSHQERGQKLVDLYLSEQKNMADAYARNQIEVWKTLNDGWKQELRSDPELGGNRLDTTLSVAKAVIEEFGGSKEQQSALLAQLDATGMGNHPAFVRILHNIGTALNVLEDRIIAAPASAKAQPTSRSERWYGGNGKGA